MELSPSDEAALAILVQDVRDANATRYFTAAGAIMLLYDHLLTLDDEYRFIWKARSSFGKYAYLLNRYLVTGIFIAVIHESCGFSRAAYSNIGCRRFLTSISLASIISFAAADLLVLLRVLILWKDNKTMKLFLYVSYFVGMCVTISMMVLTTTKLGPGTVWFAAGKMCTPTTRTPYLPAVWGSTVFELSALIAVIYNTISSPRSVRVPLSTSLRQDGIIFFLTVMIIRLTNMVFAVSARISLMLFAIFFLWALATTLLNWSLFVAFRRAESRERCIHLTRCDSCHSTEVEVEMADLGNNETIFPKRSISTH